MFNFITAKKFDHLGLITVQVKPEGHAELHIKGQIFKIKLFNHRHTSLLKNIPTTEKEKFLETTAQKIKTLIEDLIQDHQLDLLTQPIKQIKLTTDASDQMHIQIRYLKKVKDSLKKTVLKIKTSIFNHFISFEKNEIKQVKIEIQNITPDRLVQKLHKTFKDLMRKKKKKKSKAAEEVITHFKNFISYIPDVAQSFILEKMEKITNEELYLMTYLHEYVDWTGIDQKQAIAEILCGGYVYFDDGGQTYHHWSNHLEDKQSRISSHQSNGFKQYSIQGQIVKEMLFSKKIIKDDLGISKEVSWFQCERFNIKNGQFFRHLGTWFLYKLRKKNQGPYGESAHTEHYNPLILRLKNTNYT